MRRRRKQLSPPMLAALPSFWRVHKSLPTGRLLLIFPCHAVLHSKSLPLGADSPCQGEMAEGQKG